MYKIEIIGSKMQANQLDALKTLNSTSFETKIKPGMIIPPAEIRSKTQNLTFPHPKK